MLVQTLHCNVSGIVVENHGGDAINRVCTYLFKIHGR